MPSRLKRCQDTKRDSHFITFSCYKRHPFLASPADRDICQSAIEQFRIQYGFTVIAYVVMPEHVHLLVSEPENGPLAGGPGNPPASANGLEGGPFKRSLSGAFRWKHRPFGR